MRSAFFNTLQKMAEKDPNVNLVVGDLGFKVTNEFREAFPNQFLNAGVAEQNMLGVAAGMGLSGKKVFVYSIANFPILRCLEQIRNDVAYHQANVKIVAVGCGFAYGSLGMTHHAIEDLAILRSLPGMTVVAPGDPVEAAKVTEAITLLDCPVYFRLGREGEPKVHSDFNLPFQIGKAIQLGSGSDVTIISTGSILPVVANVTERLHKEGVQTRLLSMHTVKPIDRDAIIQAAAETESIVTVEEHTLMGGLGSAVAEVLADSEKFNIPVKRIGLPSVYTTDVGDQDYLRMKFGLDEEGIFNTISSFLNKVLIKK